LATRSEEPKPSKIVGVAVDNRSLCHDDTRQAAGAKAAAP
jgi:hypothetical protein